MKRLLACLLLFSTCVASGSEAPAIYRSTDEYGNPSFSDQPGPNADRVDVGKTNRTPPVEPRARPEPREEGEEDPSQYVLTIEQPANNSVIANGLIPTDIVVNVTPPLLPNHRITFALDGEMLTSSHATRHTISRLTPGSHQISAQVVDSEDRPLSEPHTARVTAYWPGNR